MAVAALDLDLEVFQGPFDLLATLDSARGDRPARGRPGRGGAGLRRAPRARRRDGPRGHHRVPGADRGPPGAEVPPDAAQRGRRVARRARRGRGRALGPPARVPPLQRHRRLPPRAPGRGVRLPLPLGPAAACAPARLAGAGLEGVRAGAAGRGDGRAAARAAAARPQAPGDGQGDDRAAPGPPSLAAVPRAGASTSTRPSTGPTARPRP